MRVRMSRARFGIFPNQWLWGAVLLSLLLQARVIYLPFLQQAFSTDRSERQRLARMRSGCKLGIVAAGVEQGYYAVEIQTEALWQLRVFLAAGRPL